MNIEEKIRKYSNMIYKIAFSMTKTKDDADDIYQEVVIKYYQNESNLQNEEHEKAWLIRVTINYCKMFYRKNKNRREEILDENIQSLDPEQDDTYMYVKKLPEKYRIVIYLFYYEGYKINEIAKILKTHEGTVKSQLSRAREMLKELMEGGFENG